MCPPTREYHNAIIHEINEYFPKGLLNGFDVQYLTQETCPKKIIYCRMMLGKMQIWLSFFVWD